MTPITDGYFYEYNRETVFSSINQQTQLPTNLTQIIQEYINYKPNPSTKELRMIFIKNAVPIALTTATMRLMIKNFKNFHNETIPEHVALSFIGVTINVAVLSFNLAQIRRINFNNKNATVKGWICGGISGCATLIVGGSLPVAITTAGIVGSVVAGGLAIRNRLLA